MSIRWPWAYVSGPRPSENARDDMPPRPPLAAHGVFTVTRPLRAEFDPCGAGPLKAGSDKRRAAR